MSTYLKYWKKRNANSYQKLIATQSFLHENSKELIEILNKHDILKPGISVFEIGCGCARNLTYILKENADIRVAGNDLNRDECYKYMDKIAAKSMSFINLDTKSMVDSDDPRINGIDLFLSSDHLMHLDPATAKYVLNKVCTKVKPKYIMLRESTVDRLVEGKAPKHAHDYSCIEDYYKIINDCRSHVDDTYRICLYERN